MSSFIDKIKAKLDADTRFHFLGKGASEGLWATREKGAGGHGDFIDLKRTWQVKGMARSKSYCTEKLPKG